MKKGIITASLVFIALRIGAILPRLVFLYLERTNNVQLIIDRYIQIFGGLRLI